jgi:tetratricopeptide (TPR) repeat protein
MGKIRTDCLICAGLLVSVLIVFWPTLCHEFINYDDFSYVVHNSHVKSGLTLPGIQWALTSTYASNWHPITWLSHMLDCQLFGLRPGGHHFTNLLFHAANTILLFLLLRTMTGALWRSAIVAALFAVHPLHVESVAWVAERKDLLSTFFMLLTLRAYVGYAQEPALKKYLPVILLFAIGLMAKPMLVTLPFVLILLDYWPLDRLEMDGKSREQKLTVLKRLIMEKAPLFLLSAASSVITLFAQTSAIWNLADIPLPTRLGNAIISYAKYLGLTFWPRDLAIIYPYPDSLGFSEIILAAAVLIVISTFVFLMAKDHRYLPVGWLWFLGTLIPVIGIVQVGSQAMADRYTYIPLVGIFIILVWGGSDLFERFKGSAKAAEIITAGLILVLMTLSARQVTYWKDGITLFQHTIRLTSDNYVAHNNLGIALAHQGKREEAAVHFREALRISPIYTHARYNLALNCQNEGKLDEAIVHYRELIRLSPSADGRNNLAVALMARGEYEEATEQLLKVIQDDPSHARAYNNYGVILMQKGDTDAARIQFEKSLRLDPNYENARSNLELAGKAKKHP